MSRDIKFRAWDITQKLMLPEVAIYFPADHIGFAIDDYIKWSGGGDVPEHVEVGEYDWAYLTDGFELMQYTGLKDKNDVEIYEGDIVKHYYRELGEPTLEDTFAVAWDNEGYWSTTEYPGEFEIIGNIYEDAEGVSNE